MSSLERHCRLLLRVYPAAYREVRGDEIIGTLLEATPEGRAWPRARDVRGLIFGGLRARAALNRQRTTAANLREAVLAGAAAFLVYAAASFVSSDVMAELSASGHIQPALSDWPILLASVLTFVAVGLALVTGRRIAVLAAALPAAAALCYSIPRTTGVIGDAAAVLALLAARLALLAALVALAGGSKRPSRGWLVLVGLFGVMPFALDFGVPIWLAAFGTLLPSVVAVSIVWAVIDARPAMAMVVFFVALWLPPAVSNLMQGDGFAISSQALVIVTIVGGGALWLLRRQSAHPGRTQTP